ncbi:uncharacterized protein MKZ38_000137 [Zalerion maritima]|uniref:Cytochrome b mRNA-processing protein 4 n=1 Tax=Zalerion maritima TaxID=339359 RepID=A0AAD5WU91_9PEZI|nr:uncharacterized protein MKZ38_000137 [Zalerion maritima]
MHANPSRSFPVAYPKARDQNIVLVNLILRFYKVSLLSLCIKISAKMPKPKVNWWLWTKAIVAGLGVAVGGPMLVWKVTPTEEEMFQRFSPELQKKSLEGRYDKQKQFDDYVEKLKEYSKSDKNIWIVMAEEDKREKKEKRRQARLTREAKEKMRQEIRREAGVSLES